MKRSIASHSDPTGLPQAEQKRLLKLLPVPQSLQFLSVPAGASIVMSDHLNMKRKVLLLLPSGWAGQSHQVIAGTHFRLIS